MSIVNAADGDHLKTLLERPEHDVIRLNPHGIHPDYDYQSDPIVINHGFMKRIVGRGRLWVNAASAEAAITYEGDEDGAHKRQLWFQGLDVNTNADAALLLINANFNRFEFCHWSGADVGIQMENRLPDGYSEGNVFEQNGVDAPRGVWFRRPAWRTNTRASFHGTNFEHLKIGNASEPILIDKGCSVYASRIHGRSWIDDADMNNAGICVWGQVHHTDFDWTIENDVGYGIFLNYGDQGPDDDPAAGSRNGQCDIRMRFVHPVNHALVTEDRNGNPLPWFRFP